MPTPKATWRFSCRSSTTSSASRNTGGIAVGRREGQQHHLSLLHGTAAQLDILPDLARHGDGRVGTQQLLDRCRHQLRFRDQAPPVVRVPAEMQDRGADGAPGRVDPGDHQQVERSEHMSFLERHAVQGAVHHHPDQVRIGTLRVGLGPALFPQCDVMAEIIPHRLGAVPVRLVVDGTDFQNLVDPADEQMLSRIGTPSM